MQTHNLSCTAPRTRVLSLCGALIYCVVSRAHSSAILCGHLTGHKRRRLASLEQVLVFVDPLAFVLRRFDVTLLDVHRLPDGQSPRRKSRNRRDEVSLKDLGIDTFVQRHTICSVGGTSLGEPNRSTRRDSWSLSRL